jgi:hypothetical protein
MLVHLALISACLLRERRATSLAQMQDAAIEVESNVLAADRLRNKADADKKKGKI